MRLMGCKCLLNDQERMNYTYRKNLIFSPPPNLRYITTDVRNVSTKFGNVVMNVANIVVNAGNTVPYVGNDNIGGY